MLLHNEIFAERDRLAQQAADMLNQLAIAGVKMVDDGMKDITTQQIFASWIGEVK